MTFPSRRTIARTSVSRRGNASIGWDFQDVRSRGVALPRVESGEELVGFKEGRSPNRPCRWVADSKCFRAASSTHHWRGRIGVSDSLVSFTGKNQGRKIWGRNMGVLLIFLSSIFPLTDSNTVARRKAGKKLRAGPPSGELDLQSHSNPGGRSIEAFQTGEPAARLADCRMAAHLTSPQIRGVGGCRDLRYDADFVRLVSGAWPGKRGRCGWMTGDSNRDRAAGRG